MLSINFITPNVSDEDLELFFGPDPKSEEFVVIEDHWTMANILVNANIFPSISQARKCGENKPIPPGFTIITRGKKKNRKELVIFNGNALR